MKLKLPSYDNNNCFDRFTQNMFENKLKDGSIVGCLEMAGPYGTSFSILTDLLNINQNSMKWTLWSNWKPDVAVYEFEQKLWISMSLKSANDGLLCKFEI